MKMRKELWFGFSLMAMIVAGACWILFSADPLTEGHLGLLMLALVVVAIMLGFPTAFTLMGMGMIFTWLAYDGNTELALTLMVQATFKVMSNDVLISVPLFVFMGYLVERANLIERLFHSISLALAWVPGSLAVATLFTCAVFATATGIVGAVVTLMGLLAMPQMLRNGYDVRLSAGAITAGGCLGILIPPSVLLIVYGATAGVSVVQLYAGAFFPGLMLTGLYIAYVILLAKFKPALAPPLPLSERVVPLPPRLAAIASTPQAPAVGGLLKAIIGRGPAQVVSDVSGSEALGSDASASGASASEASGSVASASEASGSGGASASGAPGSDASGPGASETTRLRRYAIGQLAIALLPLVAFAAAAWVGWYAAAKPAPEDSAALQSEARSPRAEAGSEVAAGAIADRPAAGNEARVKLPSGGLLEPPGSDSAEPLGEPELGEPELGEPGLSRSVGTGGLAEPPGSAPRRSQSGGLAEPPAEAMVDGEEGPRQTPAGYWIGLAVGLAALVLSYRKYSFARFELFKMLLGSFFPLVILILAVLGSIVMGLATPTEAAAVGALGGALLAAAYGRLTVSVVRESAFLTAKTSAMVCWLFVGSAIFSAAFALLGGQELVERWVLSLDLTTTQFMVLTQVIIFILGWPLEWTEIIVIFMPIFIPLLDNFGVNPLFFGLLVALNLQTAFLSPPVAMAAFYLKGVSPPHVTLNQIFAGMLPFMGIQILAIVLLYWFPEIGLWLPKLLYGT